MMSRATRTIANFVIAVVVCVATASALTVILNFPTGNPAQEHSEWCWAGTSQAILAYYGQTVNQCTIANYASGYPSVAGRTDCCATSGYWVGDTTGTCSTSCNCWNYMYGSGSGWNVAGGSLQGILTHWGVASSAAASSLSKQSVINAIGARLPIIMRFGWTSGGGHFLNIYGHEQDATYLDYWDPLPGNGATRSLYTWVVSASDHSWTHTLTMTTTPPSNAPTFTDDPLVARATRVKAVHITELRTDINALRTRYGLGNYMWADSTLGVGATPVKALHITELRTALAAVFTTAGRSQPSYTNALLTAGSSVVSKQDIAEIRTAIVGIW